MFEFYVDVVELCRVDFSIVEQNIIPEVLKNDPFMEFHKRQPPGNC